MDRMNSERIPTPGENDVLPVTPRAAPPAKSCDMCKLLNVRLDNAAAEIERLRALVRPADRYVVRYG